MKLYDMKKGDTFTHDDTVYTLIGIDGMYAKIQWELCGEVFDCTVNVDMEVLDERAKV